MTRLKGGSNKVGQVKKGGDGRQCPNVRKALPSGCVGTPLLDFDYSIPLTHTPHT
jgi:hypothetical protein